MANFLNKIGDMIFGAEEDYDDEFPMHDEEVSEPVSHSSRKNKVVDITSTTQLKVVVMQPDSFDEAKEIADHLKTRKPVIINLEKLEKESARRMIDFVSGASYALGGEIQKVAGAIFLIAPFNVSILGDFKDELKNKGIFPWSN